VYPAAVQAFQLLEVALKANAADVPPFVHSPHVPVLVLVLVIWTLFAAQPVWVPEHEVFGPVESSPAALAIPGAQAVHTLALTWWLMRQFSALTAISACRANIRVANRRLLHVVIPC
jgi:hypothetical protein